VTASDYRCDQVTPAMHAIDDVPSHARWRLSCKVPRGPGTKTLSVYALTDEAARRWCAKVRIRFPGDQPASPAAERAAPAPDATPMGMRALTDHRARASGETET
jgi:hypothetical protein